MGPNPAARHERAPTPQPAASSPPPHLLSQSGGGRNPTTFHKQVLTPIVTSGPGPRSPTSPQPTRCRAAGGAALHLPHRAAARGQPPPAPPPTKGRLHISMLRNACWVAPTTHPDLEAEREVSIYREEKGGVFCVRGKLTAEATHGVLVTHAPPRGRSERRAARGSSRAPPARGG